MARKRGHPAASGSGMRGEEVAEELTSLSRKPRELQSTDAAAHGGRRGKENGARVSRRFIYDVYVDLVRQFNRTVQDEPSLICAACLIELGSFSGLGRARS